MKPQTSLVLSALILGAAGLGATEVKVVATHNARFNLTGNFLGAHPDHTPLVLKNVAPGAHKLYVSSLITDELIVFQFTANGREGSPLEYKANFRPPPDTKNMKARRRTAIAGGAVLNETVGDGSTAGRVVVGAAAIANELVKSRNTDRDYSAKYGNTLEIKSQEDVDVNLDGQGAQSYTQADAKRWHGLSPGEHKVYIRSRVTQELKLFSFAFPSGNVTDTVTIRPEFRPPAGETVNAQARRRTGILGALAANELFRDGTGKKDVRKVGVGVAVVNELLGSKAGRTRAAVTLDLQRLPSDLKESLD